MSEQITKTLKTIGVTPWQFILGVACIGSWWATVQPLPGAIKELNATVQEISRKVEVHSVLLSQVAEVRAELQRVSGQVSTISGKLAHVPGYPSRRSMTSDEQP